MKIELNINGAEQVWEEPPVRRLLDVLRDRGLAGAKEGCGEGECGACTVMLDGDPVCSCLVAVGQCAGREVVTVEGLPGADANGPLGALQRAFIEYGGAQCGICTPGMLISAEALLRRVPAPSEQAIREALAGNLCRCTGYQRIVDSVVEAAVERTADRKEPS